MRKLINFVGRSLVILIAIGAIGYIVFVERHMPGHIASRAVAPEPFSCTSSQVTGALKGLIESIQLPLGAGSVKVIDIYKYRPNPNLGGTPVPFTDTKNPCKTNVLTERGEFGFTYGWQTFNDKTYIVGQLADPADTTSESPSPPAPQSSPPAPAVDMTGFPNYDVKAYCAQSSNRLGLTQSPDDCAAMQYTFRSGAADGWPKLSPAVRVECAQFGNYHALYSCTSAHVN